MFSRHSNSIAALALASFVVAACGKSGPSVTVAGTAEVSSSGQPDIQLLRTNDLTSDPSLERVAATVVLPEGGLIALSNRRGGFPSILQHDTVLKPSDCGGPLVNLEGQVVGINTAIITGGRGNEGVGFALPSNTAIGVYNQIVMNGKVTRGSIGWMWMC